MVITLDNRQTITVYEKQNIFPQIKEYIDKEIYDLLVDKFSNSDELVLKNEYIEEKLEEADNYIDELIEKIDKLNEVISNLEDELDD